MPRIGMPAGQAKRRTVERVLFGGYTRSNIYPSKKLRDAEGLGGVMRMYLF